MFMNQVMNHFFFEIKCLNVQIQVWKLCARPKKIRMWIIKMLNNLYYSHEQLWTEPVTNDAHPLANKLSYETKIIIIWIKIQPFNQNQLKLPKNDNSVIVFWWCPFHNDATFQFTYFVGYIFLIIKNNRSTKWCVNKIAKLIGPN